ncbi:hypothetical protein [Okeania sp. SIO3I5]|nr:hypothetical protein [Okeania sp. SIO3I5]
MERSYKVLVVLVWFINLKSAVMFYLLSNSYCSAEKAIAIF